MLHRWWIFQTIFTAFGDPSSMIIDVASTIIDAGTSTIIVTCSFITLPVFRWIYSLNWSSMIIDDSEIRSIMYYHRWSSTINYLRSTWLWTLFLVGYHRWSMIIIDDHKDQCRSSMIIDDHTFQSSGLYNVIFHHRLSSIISKDHQSSIIIDDHMWRYGLYNVI